jgi:hypothetical protein
LGKQTVLDVGSLFGKIPMLSINTAQKNIPMITAQRLIGIVENSFEDLLIS